MKNKIVMAAIALVLLGGSYYVGTMSVSKSNQPTFSGPGGDQQGAGRAGMMRTGKNVVNRNNMNFISGEVISKDVDSLTIKMRDGSTKNVFYSDKTKISKQVDGLMDDVVVGTSIMVNGDNAQDGSVGAKDIQIRPLMFNASTTPTSTQVVK